MDLLQCNLNLDKLQFPHKSVAHSHISEGEAFLRSFFLFGIHFVVNIW